MKAAGNIAVHYVAYQLLKREYEVGFIASDNSPYDLFVERAGKVWRVQVKSSATLDKSAGHHAYRVIAGRGKSSKERLTKADCDMIIVVVGDPEVIYCIPIQAIKGVTVRLYPLGRKKIQQNIADYEMWRGHWDWV